MESLQLTTVNGPVVERARESLTANAPPPSRWPLPEFPDYPRCPKRPRSFPCDAKPQTAATRKIKKGNKKAKSRRQRFSKRNWAADEDALLRQLVKAERGEFNWSDIARHFENRVGKQCRERWHNHLKDDLVKTVWTEEEDARLIRLHAAHGNSWAYLTQFFPGRTDNMIKNRWNTTLSRRPPAPNSSALGSPSAPLKVPPSGALETAADFGPLSHAPAGLHLPTFKTFTSLEESRSELVSTPVAVKRPAFVPVAAGRLEESLQSLRYLELTSPQFWLRIPVFNRGFVELRTEILQK